MGANNALNNMTGTALVTNKAASTTYTLTAASQNFQIFTNSGFVSGSEVQLPVTSTLMLGRTFTIINSDPTQILPVNSSGGNLIATIPINSFATFICVNLTVTDSTGWQFDAKSVAPELIFSQVDSGSAVSLTNGILSNITSIVIPAGIWRVTGNVAYIPGATTSVTSFTAGFNNTSGVLNVTIGTNYCRQMFRYPAFVPGENQVSFPLFEGRLVVNSPTTIYLIAGSNFTISTMTCYGVIMANRIG